ncbi:MAG TPA: hypothetical protein VNI20_03995 [Fimbriimonadaceae bacterium]|nr:hypothetical protein [Fimbriimonadaceae bacterium]
MIFATLLLGTALQSSTHIDKIPVEHNRGVEVYNWLSPMDNANGLIPGGVTQIVFDPTDNSIIVKGTDEAIETLKKEIKLMVSAQTMQKLPVEHMSGKVLYNRFFLNSKALVPDGLLLSASNADNTIVAIGSKDKIRQAGQLISQFDKQPRTLSLSLEGSVPKLGRRFSSSSTLANNSTWTYVDDSTDTRIEITPRVNADNTITLIGKAGALGTRVQIAQRVKSGTYAYVILKPEKPEGASALTSMVVMTGSAERPSSEFFGDQPRLNALDLIGRQVALDVPVPAEAELRFFVRVTLP